MKLEKNKQIKSENSMSVLIQCDTQNWCVKLCKLECNYIAQLIIMKNKNYYAFDLIDFFWVYDLWLFIVTR